MTKKRRRRGITPWKKTALKVCVLWLVLAASIHAFRTIKAAGFEDQREAARWGSSDSCAQVSAFLPSENALKEENIRDLEYKINSARAQDSIKLTAQGEDARLWQDCYSGIGSLTLAAGSKTVKVEAVGTGGAFFTFHPLHLSSGSFYLSDSPMKDEILLDQETAWKLFGSFNVVGRSVRVEDMYLRIAGVYKKEEGGLYEKGGLSDYVVFVQYKTLLQYGGTGKNTGNGTAAPSTASSPAALFVATEGPVKNTENGSESQEGTSSGSEQNSENVGTGNTRYTDTGMITTYEIVMPDPVDGYAAAAVTKALGEDSHAIVVDNTNRYRFPNLFKDIRDFALLGMRTESVRYPYWENVAMGWETIFAALLLLECILIALTILLLIWMLLHWYRHKTWTVAGSFRNMQESVYERQSRKRYPEYYREKEQDEPDEEAYADEEPAPETESVPGESAAAKEAGRLEDKGLTPFETIQKNRKAVEYETKYQNDQRGTGSGDGADPDSVRRQQQ